MAKKYHVIYLVIIALLGLAVAFSIAFGFKSAEKQMYPPLKSFYVQTLLGHRYADFSGAWKIEGEESFLKHAYKYKCTDEDMTCIVADAAVHNDSLGLDVTTLPINTWTDREITITEEAACRTNTILVDLLTEKVVMISKDVPNRNEQICNGLDVLKEPRRSELVDGVSAVYGTK